jgi:hypothetical protein
MQFNFVSLQNGHILIDLPTKILYIFPVSYIQDMKKVFLLMNEGLVMKRPVSVHNDLEFFIDFSKHVLKWNLGTAN